MEEANRRVGFVAHLAGLDAKPVATLRPPLGVTSLARTHGTAKEIGSPGSLIDAKTAPKRDHLDERSDERVRKDRGMLG